MAGVRGNDVVRGKRVGQNSNVDAAFLEIPDRRQVFFLNDEVGRFDEDFLLERRDLVEKGPGHGTTFIAFAHFGRVVPDDLSGRPDELIPDLDELGLQRVDILVQRVGERLLGDALTNIVDQRMKIFCRIGAVHECTDRYRPLAIPEMVEDI